MSRPCPGAASRCSTAQFASPAPRRLAALAGCAFLVAAALALGLGLGARPALAAGLPTYVVQPGDTLWGIAAEDGLTVAQLAAANGLVATDVLPAGEVLQIPPRQSGPAPSPAAPPAPPPAGSSPAASSTTTRTVSSVTTLSPGAASVSPAGGVACPQVAGNPYGQLPALLAASPDRQALLGSFREWSAAYGVSAPLLEAIAWQESGWQSGVVSAAGAIGVGQLLPSTVQFVETDLLGTTLDPWSGDDNIRMMARYVAYLAAQEGGNPCATIAAYYEGAANVASYGILPVSVPYIADVEALMPRFE